MTWKGRCSCGPHPAVYARTLSVWVIFVFSSVGLMAQRSTYRQYGSADGLTDMTIYCLLQDHTGYIWAGTDNGLFRYDGSHFVAFHNEDGLPNSTIRAIAESPEGVIWAATGGGVARSVGSAFQEVDVGERGVFRAVAFDRLGRMYLESSTGIALGMPDGSGNYRFHKVAQGTISGLTVHDEDVWFGRGGDLWHLAGKVAKPVGSPAGLPADRWSSVVLDSLGNLWTLSATRLYELPNGKTRFVDKTAGLPKASFIHLNTDSRGRLFVSSDAGVTEMEGEERIPLDAAHGLPADGVRTVMLDREGSLWIGAAGSGLIRQLGRGDWLSWKKADGLLHNTIWAVISGQAGQIWVGSNGGLNLLDPRGKVTHSWTSRTGLAGDEVFAITSGPAGDIYASTYPTGISHFSSDGVLLKTYRSVSALSAGWILAMAVDQQDRLWTTGATGCFRSRSPLDKGDPIFDRVDIPGMGLGTKFDDVLIDGNSVWITGSRGLARYRDGQWRVFTKRDGLKSQWVSVVARGRGAIWIAYRDALGMTRLDFAGEQVKPTQFTINNGLASDKIYAIAFDPAGRLWATSDAGVDVLDQGWWRHYDTEDGLIWNDADTYALDTAADGHVWIGTSAGLSRYSPPRDRIADGPPTVVIDSIEGNSRQWKPGDRPALPYEKRSMFIRYAALNYASESHIRFRYRLLGYETGWTETREKSLRFEGLPAGHYTFQVVAAGPNDPWATSPSEFAFSITVPWWQSWWFLSACLTTAALLISALWRLRVRLLITQKTRLEHSVAERTAELTESHRQLEEIAYYDTLTLVPNRRRFTEQLHSRLKLAHSANERFALLLIDLDHFKQINDTFGHDAGDAVLVESAQRLLGAVRDSDCVARLGGDEFAILLNDAHERAGIEKICERIVDYSNFGIPFSENMLRVSTSIGVAVYPDDGDTEKSLYKSADLALYEAKQTRSRFCFRHSPSAQVHP